MKTRVAATILWSITGWSTGALLGWMLGLAPILAPVLAIAAGLIVATDPRHLIWRRPVMQGWSPATLRPQVR